MITILKYRNKEEASKYVARIIGSLIKQKPDTKLLLPTGSSPILVYKELVKQNLDWNKITTFNLDEYVDVKNEYSYHEFMHKNLFQFIQTKASYFPNEDAYLKNYYDIDLALLGVGVNGHIAFNEPGTELNSTVHIVNLTNSTKLANKSWFENDYNKVPNQAITAGLSDILKAKKIILLAFGESKRNALKEFLKNQYFDKHLPISALWNANEVVIVTDIDL